MSHIRLAELCRKAAFFIGCQVRRCFFLPALFVDHNAVFGGTPQLQHVMNKTEGWPMMGLRCINAFFGLSSGVLNSLQEVSHLSLCSSFQIPTVSTGSCPHHIWHRNLSFPPLSSLSFSFSCLVSVSHFFIIITFFFFFFLIFLTWYQTDVASAGKTRGFPSGILWKLGGRDLGLLCYSEQQSQQRTLCRLARREPFGAEPVSGARNLVSGKTFYGFYRPIKMNDLNANSNNRTEREIVF